MTSSEEVGDHTHRLDGTSATRHQTDAEVRVQYSVISYLLKLISRERP